MAKDKRIVKPRKGPLPDLLRKGSAHKDKTKYKRRPKHEHKNVDDT